MLHEPAVRGKDKQFAVTAERPLSVETKRGAVDGAVGPDRDTLDIGDARLRSIGAAGAWAAGCEEGYGGEVCYPTPNPRLGGRRSETTEHGPEHSRVMREPLHGAIPSRLITVVPVTSEYRTSCRSGQRGLSNHRSTCRVA